MAGDDQGHFGQMSNDAPNLVSPIEAGVEHGRRASAQSPVKSIEAVDFADLNSQLANPFPIDSVVTQKINLVRELGWRAGKDLKEKILRSSAAEAGDQMDDASRGDH
jgi:hypothetical protein